ncbi:MAG: hypothetical protein ACKOWF_10835 [Chloroflexota bacterium]
MPCARPPVRATATATTNATVTTTATPCAGAASGTTLPAEFAAGGTGAFPPVRLYRHACGGRGGGRCVAACPAGMLAISGGLEGPAGGPAYRLDAASWAVTLPAEAAARPVILWVMCLGEEGVSRRRSDA